MNQNDFLEEYSFQEQEDLQKAINASLQPERVSLRLRNKQTTDINANLDSIKIYENVAVITWSDIPDSKQESYLKIKDHEPIYSTILNNPLDCGLAVKDRVKKLDAHCKFIEKSMNDVAKNSINHAKLPELILEKKGGKNAEEDPPFDPSAKQQHKRKAAPQQAKKESPLQASKVDNIVATAPEQEAFEMFEIPAVILQNEPSTSADFNFKRQRIVPPNPWIKVEKKKSNKAAKDNSSENNNRRFKVPKIQVLSKSPTVTLQNLRSGNCLNDSVASFFNSYRRSTSPIEEKQVKCPICFKMFSDKNIEGHAESCQQPAAAPEDFDFTLYNPITCEKCDQTFLTADEFEDHVAACMS